MGTNTKNMATKLKDLEDKTIDSEINYGILEGRINNSESQTQTTNANCLSENGFMDNILKTMTDRNSIHEQILDVLRFDTFLDGIGWENATDVELGFLYFGKEKVELSKGQNFCQKLSIKAHLVEIHSQQQQDYLVQRL